MYVIEKGTLRISFHIDTKKEDIQYLVQYMDFYLSVPDPGHGEAPVTDPKEEETKE